MDIWAAVLKCPQQLLLWQGPKYRDHRVQIAVVFYAAQETFPLWSGPDLLIHASLHIVRRNANAIFVTQRTGIRQKIVESTYLENLHSWS